MKYIRLYIPLVLIAVFAGLVGTANQAGIITDGWMAILMVNVLLVAAGSYHYTHPFRKGKSIWSLYIMGCFTAMISLNGFLWLMLTRGTIDLMVLQISFGASSMGFLLMVISGIQAVRSRRHYKWSAVLSLLGHGGLFMVFTWGVAKEFIPVPQRMQVSGVAITLLMLGSIFICIATHYLERTLLLAYPIPDDVQLLLEQIGEDEAGQSA